jgi:hypothetical protein
MISPVSIGVDEWADASADLLVFDRRVHAAEDEQKGPVYLQVRNGVLPALDSALATRQIRTRYQRCMPIRNSSSAGADFDRVLERHRALHDLTKPLVRADYDHAIDTWQWMLRLDANAAAPLQVAALFHDIERLESEATVRVEQDAADYQSFKDAHARRGAELVREHLGGVVEARVVEEAARLVASHERPLEDPDLALLNDADGLSFFGVNSWGFVAHFGAEHTRKKVAYTLARMRSLAKVHLAGLRHPTVIVPWLK